MVLVVFIVLTYVVCFKLAPAIGNIVTRPEMLPAGPRIALWFSKHPFYYWLGIGGILTGIFLFIKSGVWKILVPAYNDFERLRFLSWLKILTESGFNFYESLLFLYESGFSKEWKKKIDEAASEIETGTGTEKVVEEFKGLLKFTDITFLKTGLATGDISREVDPLLRVLEKEVKRSIKKSSDIMNTIILIVAGLLIGLVYGGVVIPLTTGIQRAM